MPETIASKRITLVEKENYTVDLEYNGDFAILHLPVVTKFTKSVYQDMLVKTQEIWEFVSASGYKALFLAIDPNDKTINKFVKRIGFIHLGDDSGMAVYQYKEYSEWDR